MPRAGIRVEAASIILLPPDYDGPLLPGAYSYRQRTNHGFAVLRPIIPDASPANIARAADICPGHQGLSISNRPENPPANQYVDIYDKHVEMTPVLDGGIYAELNEIIQEEVVDLQNLARMGSFEAYWH